jgi:hypothetical protein
MTPFAFAVALFNALLAFGLGMAYAGYRAGLPRRIESLHIAIGATRSDRVRVEMDGFAWLFGPEDAARFGLSLIRCAEWTIRRRG